MIAEARLKLDNVAIPLMPCILRDPSSKELPACATLNSVKSGTPEADQQEANDTQRITPSGKDPLWLGSQAHSNCRGYENTRCQSCREQRVGRIEKPAFASDEKRVHPTTAVVQRANKTRKNNPPREPYGFMSSEECGICQESEKSRAESCSGGTTSRTKVVTKAVFTKQGASASQMAAARFLDTISRFPCMTGEASDAVTAYIQVNMIGAPRLDVARSRLSRFMDQDSSVAKTEKLRQHCRPRASSLTEFVWPPSGRPSSGETIGRSALQDRMGEKCRHGNVYTCTKKLGWFLSVHVDDFKMVVRKQNVRPMWKRLKKGN